MAAYIEFYTFLSCYATSKARIQNIVVIPDEPDRE